LNFGVGCQLLTLNTNRDIYEAFTDIGFNRLSRCFPAKAAAFANDNLSHRVIFDLGDAAGEPIALTAETYDKRYREVERQVGQDTERYSAGSKVKHPNLSCEITVYVRLDGVTIRESNYLCSYKPLDVINFR
jgi:hypothetical protein